MLTSKSNDARPKHEIIRDLLRESLRSGEFEVGRRLPADKDLAARYRVSYMTARKAVNELVEASLLERRIGDGTYVRAGSQQRLSTTTLNLVCTAYEGSTARSFLRLGGVAALGRGWRSHVVRIHGDHEQGALRALESGELSLVLADEEFWGGPLPKAMQQARGRVVLLGWRLDEKGVPSVLADDAGAVRLAIERLQKAGHQKIAWLGNHIGLPNERLQLEAWSAHPALKLLPREKESFLIKAETPPFQCASRFAYRATREWLARFTAADRPTAIISVSDELAVGALSACRDAGCAVPHAMSMINLNDSSALEFSHPRMTCVDIDLEGHIEKALQLFNTEQNLSTSAPQLHLVAPKLIERESVTSPQSH